LWENGQTSLPVFGFERHSVVRVLPPGKGEYREPGLQENSVRNFTGRRNPIPTKNLPRLVRGDFFVDK
jgi:hypothetical protein